MRLHSLKEVAHVTALSPWVLRLRSSHWSTRVRTLRRSPTARHTAVPRSKPAGRHRRTTPTRSRARCPPRRCHCRRRHHHRSTATMKPLRKGTNGWTCIPDLPRHPGPDPMCLDQNGMEWANAWMTKTAAAGGQDGLRLHADGRLGREQHRSVRDQAGSRRQVGRHRPARDGAQHRRQFAGYPTTATNTKVPYVMFPDTPYAHLMIPVKSDRVTDDGYDRYDG